VGTPNTESPIQTPLREKDADEDNNSTEIKRAPDTGAVQKPATNPSKAPRRVKGARNPKRKDASIPVIDHIQPYIFYFTLGGSTRAHAEKLAATVEPNSRISQPIVHDLTEIDYDDFFISPPKQPSVTAAAFYIILIPSYDIDTELSNFLSNLDETHHDFRIDTAPLRGLAGYSVFGFGDMQEWPSEREGYCSQAIEVDKWMAKLTGRKRAFPLGTADVKGDDAQLRLEEWTRGVLNITQDLSEGKGLGEGVLGSGEAVESGDEAEDDDDGRITKTTASDLEDIKAPIPVDFTTSNKKPTQIPSEPKAMVPTTSPTYTSLTKQGYTIVGTHSGVKICRWTKSALRGRGSCYKFSFYGIASHQCMEATPSLSCSNKCVFCWRHGSNPVGTTWRWQVDPADEIFTGIKAGHYQKIKMMRGVPGVRAERFAEAMRIRHCALSLVGEPIFYPHINELLSMLHAEHISSFLVCNAQHPDQLATLGPVTQLYVSIDASNKEQLRKIDRPLHRDFWERFTRCMDILREKRMTHRTVFRLTLVKGFNIDDEAKGYADLVERALPGFVEVKGVTYCGTSTAAGAGLTMQNVPFYEEVCAFVLALEKELNARGLEYGIGAEHAHSCCILLADKKRFYRENEGGGKWHTLIDYPAFFRCVESGKPFGPEDYIGGPTPDWAAWGNGGFDPRDERVDRKGRPKEVKASGKVEEAKLVEI
jgi:tRNA wybutosine-synthesizing protein 1